MKQIPQQIGFQMTRLHGWFAKHKKGERTMRIVSKFSAAVVSLMLVVLAWTLPALAAVNQATDPGGGGVSLSNSGNVTVNSATLQLVKQVYDTANNCLASIPADVNCNTSAVSVTVPAGTTLNFLIFVRNTTGASASNVRIQDAMDETATGFNFIDSSLKWNNNVTASGATLATIFSDSNTVVLTDTVVGPDDIASAVDTGASPAGKDNITIGTVAGQVNTTLNIPATTTFGFRFQATKK